MSILTLPWRSPEAYLRAAMERLRGGAAGPSAETSPCHADPRLRTRSYKISLRSLRALLEAVIPSVERWGRPLQVASRSNEGDRVFTMHIEAHALFLPFDLFLRAREDGDRVRVDAVAQPRLKLNDLGESTRMVSALLEAVDRRLARQRGEQMTEA